MSSTEPGAAAKNRKDRACDACRRRKTRCDGPWTPNNVCTNCAQARKPCTYLDASKPRGPPKAYVTALEDRQDALEALLQELSPDDDHSHELGPRVIRGSWRTDEFPSSSKTIANRSSNAPFPPLTIPVKSEEIPFSLGFSPSSPVKDQPQARFLKGKSSQTFATRTSVLASPVDSSTDDGESSSDSGEIVTSSAYGRMKTILQANEVDDSLTPMNAIAFHGRSSTAGLVEATRRFKHIHMREKLRQMDDDARAPDNTTIATTRRALFWKTSPWEMNYPIAQLDSPHFQPMFQYFPPPDLADELIDLYFTHSNVIFPLLHRPTFIRQRRENLQHRNLWFACVCSTVFAVASRWCHDERVLPEQSRSSQNRPADWKCAGQRYYEIAAEIHTARRNIFQSASLFEIQSFILMGMYIKSSSHYALAWSSFSVGIRKAQDRGAHRKKVYSSQPTVEEELWKRAFWHLVVFDRTCGATLGRACVVVEEDFDIDLPLEVDDDYWEPSDGRPPFTQPEGILSTVTAFNQFIKLGRIAAFAMRTLYAINKSQAYYGLIPMDSESLMARLLPAMEDWLAEVPLFLRPKDDFENPIFAQQSDMLFSSMHAIELMLYRASIAPPTTPSQSPQDMPSTVNPNIALCSEAANRCAAIVSRQLRSGFVDAYIPSIIDVAYYCASWLAFNSWNLKVEQRSLKRLGKEDMKSSLDGRLAENVDQSKVFSNVLQALRQRWPVAESLLEEVKISLSGLDGTENRVDLDAPPPEFSSRMSSSFNDGDRHTWTPSKPMSNTSSFHLQTASTSTEHFPDPQSRINSHLHPQPPNNVQQYQSSQPQPYIGGYVRRSSLSDQAGDEPSSSNSAYHRPQPPVTTSIRHPPQRSTLHPYYVTKAPTSLPSSPAIPTDSPAFFSSHQSDDGSIPGERVHVAEVNHSHMDVYPPGRVPLQQATIPTWSAPRYWNQHDQHGRPQHANVDVGVYAQVPHGNHYDKAAFAASSGWPGQWSQHWADGHK